MTYRVGRAVSRGHGISYEDAGSGFPIVLINGLTGRAAEWRDLGFVDRLAPAYRVLGVDSLGHGLSDTPHEWEAYRAPMVGADIVAAMDDAGTERAAVWGYSRGAWLAAIVAAEYPDRVAALIVGGVDLVTPPSPEVPPWTESMCRGDWDAFWEAFGEVSDRDRAEMMLCDPQAICAADLGWRRSDYRVDLGRITVPTLLYCGGGDDPEEMDATAEALGVPVSIVGDGDHLATFADVDAIVPLVLAHLRRAGIQEARPAT
jgi:pimeloyl-ACP methyl ester carboxylesterase